MRPWPIAWTGSPSSLSPAGHRDEACRVLAALVAQRPPCTRPRDPSKTERRVRASQVRSVGDMRRGKQGRAIMIALPAIVMLTAACSSSPNQATTPAGPTQRTTNQAVTRPPRAGEQQEFVSKRYGFRVTLTKDWSEHDAQVDWNGGELQGLDSPAFADFT